MYKHKLFGLKYFCYLPSCLDEYLGITAIIIGLVAFFLQLGKTAETLNVSSWSISALILVAISEALFCIQGLIKKSYSIALTRFFTFCGACVYIYFWIKAKNEEKEKQ